MLVATLLSAILIGFVVTIFSFLVGRVNSESNRMGQMEDLLLLQTGLQEVVSRSDSLTMDDTLVLFSGPGSQQAGLQITDSMIVFSLDEVCDTFRLLTSDARFTFLGETTLISAIEFEVSFRTFSVPVSVFKDYDGKTLVNSGISVK
jgi:hypothetical protein